MAEENRLARLLALAALLWRRKAIIAAGTLAGAVLGVAYALLAPEVFVSRAVIYPKEVSATREKSLLGGGLGATLNPIAGVSHLSRVEIVLNSPELAVAVVRGRNLMPDLFPGRWDSAVKRWKGTPPAEPEGGRRLRERIATRVDAYKLTLEVKAYAGSAVLAHRILDGYLEALNERMKATVIRDAAANRDFLESQLEKTYDPWIREKIQQLILSQIETGMMLNANAFEVLEGPELPRLRASPVRKRIVLVAAALAFGLACGGVLVAAAVRNGRETAPRS